MHPPRSTPGDRAVSGRNGRSAGVLLFDFGGTLDADGLPWARRFHDAYVEAGHNVWVLDDESSGKASNIHPKALFTRLDLSDASRVRRFFKGKKNRFSNFLP